MSDLIHASPSFDSQSSQSPFAWLSSPLALTVFVAAATGLLFFVAEHNVAMSKTAAFVENIEEQESWSAGGNKLRQVSFIGVAFIGAVSLLLGRKGNFRLNLPVLLIAAYVLWAGASAVWSIDSGTSVRRYFVIICCIVGCFGFSRFLKIEDAVFAAVILSAGYLMLGIAAEVLYGTFRPHVGDYRFAGTIHPNNQGANLAIGSLAAFTMAKVKPKFKTAFYFIFCVLFLFLVLTKCRSATGAVPVTLGVVWLISQSKRNIVVGMLIGFWFVSSIGLFFLVTGFDPISEYQEVLLLGRGEETGSSLTGRLPLWQDLSVYIQSRPWQGHGYGAFWTPRHIYEIAVSQEWVISEAHSSYIDAVLQLGIIGAILLALTEIATFLFAAITFRITKQPAYLFLAGGTFFCLIRGFTESGLGDPAAISAFLFISLAAHTWNGRQKKSIDTDNSVNDHLQLAP